MPWLLLIALLAPPAPAAPPTPSDTAPLDIKADRLALDRKAGTATFEGAVEVRQGPLVLRCATLSATYADGEIATLTAEGPVEVRGEDWIARAARARYARQSGRLELTGDPHIERDGDVLRGERVLIWPADERLVVEKARGRVRAPRLPSAPR